MFFYHGRWLSIVFILRYQFLYFLSVLDLISVPNKARDAFASFFKIEMTSTHFVHINFLLLCFMEKKVVGFE